MIRPTQARISTSHLLNNLEILRSHISTTTRVMAVVKANGYGNGISICAPALEKAGVDMFGIATVEEARELRRLGVQSRITLLTTPFADQREAFPELDLEPLVSNRETAEWLSRRAAATGSTLRCHLYVDTGMTRNGASPEEVLSLMNVVAKLPGLTIQGLASHFATSDELDQTYARQQLTTFDAVLRESLDAGYHFQEVHIANSGGILNLPESHYTLVRPGLMLYGYHPHPKMQEESGLKPVMTLRTVITSLRRIPAGTHISYGRRYTTAQDSWIATLPIGYGDGLMRNLSGKFEGLINGKRFPVVGTICMDEVMINIGDDTSVCVGDEVVLIGESGTEKITAWDMATESGTIPYEITSSIAARVPRVSHDESPHREQPDRSLFDATVQG